VVRASLETPQDGLLQIVGIVGLLRQRHRFGHRSILSLSAAQLPQVVTQLPGLDPGADDPITTRAGPQQQAHLTAGERGAQLHSSAQGLQLQSQGLQLLPVIVRGGFGRLRDGRGRSAHHQGATAHGSQGLSSGQAGAAVAGVGGQQLHLSAREPGFRPVGLRLDLQFAQVLVGRAFADPQGLQHFGHQLAIRQGLQGGQVTGHCPSAECADRSRTSQGQPPGRLRRGKRAMG